MVCIFVFCFIESDFGVLKVLFYYNNDDYDEVLFYYVGDFFSCDNIEVGMVIFYLAGFIYGLYLKVF